MNISDDKSIIQKAKGALKESKYVDFKSQFDIGSKADWCELIKDIVAIANTGAGIILFGVHDNGKPSEYDVSKLIKIDPADVTNKISPYTGTQFDGFYIKSVKVEEGL